MPPQTGITKFYPIPGRSMKVNKYLIFSAFIWLSQSVIGQSVTGLEGSYVSKKRFSDVWTLTLNSDSTYTFEGLSGEKIEPGQWSVDEGKLVLYSEYLGQSYETVFKIKKPSKRSRFKCKTRPFRWMRLRDSP